MEHKSPAEEDQDVEMALTNGGPPENGPDRLGVSEYKNAKGQGACCKSKWKNVLIGIQFVALIILIIFISVREVQCQREKPQQAALRLLDGCPHGWVKKKDSCYFTSDVQQDWNYSQSYCSSYGASLMTLNSEEEWALVKDDEYWIDLQRETADHLWKWPDGSNVTQFDVKGTGLCGYVSDDRVSSTNCDNIRRWICRKPVQAA